MKYLWFYFVCWKHRSFTRLAMFEQYTLVLKAARRCAYDLKHASAAREEDGPMFYERSNMWLEVFSPTGGKNYRHELHSDIDSRDAEIERLKQVLIHNGLDPEDPDRIPF
jgi:hypothetical protein